MLGRKLEVKLVKDKKVAAEEGNEFPIAIPEEAISRVVRDTVNRVAIGVIAVIGAAVVLSSIGDIIVNTVDNHQQKD